MRLGNLVGLAVTGSVPPAMVDKLHLEQYIGVEGNVLIAVIVGALAAIVFVKGKEPRKELFMVAAGSVALGCALTSLIGLAVHWKFEVDLAPKHMASFGIMIGALLRFVIPHVIERIPKWMDSIRIPFISKSKTGD